MSKPVVFEDIFEVLAADPGGKHFDKGTGALSTCQNSLFLMAAPELCSCGCAVTRFQCHSDLYEMDLMLDINTSIYPLHVSSRCTQAACAGIC